VKSYYRMQPVGCPLVPRAHVFPSLEHLAAYYADCVAGGRNDGWEAVDWEMEAVRIETSSVEPDQDMRDTYLIGPDAKIVEVCVRFTCWMDMRDWCCQNAGG